MARFRAKLIGTGTTADPIRVDLPTYAMVANSELPAAAPFQTVLVDIPDDEFDTNTGRPSKITIRRKYKGQSWDRPDVGDDT